MSTGQWVFIAAWGLLVLLLVPQLLLDYRGRMATGLQHLAIWGLLFLTAISAYAFRDEIKGLAGRVTGEFSPYGSTVSIADVEGERAVRIRRSPRGSFYATANVNGAELPMLVDTGASMVVLKAADAERAGIDLKSLAYTVAVDTANGSTFCAPVRINDLSVGGIRFQKVEALVAQPGSLKESLLGMSFLKRLRSYGVSGEFMTLRS